MYKKGIYTVTANEPLTPSVWRMTLEGDTQYLTRPGQFVNIEVEGLYLRRPISVCDYNERTLTLSYKVVGEGTARLSEMKTGEKLDLLTGLGNGFDPDAECRRPLLVGGGVGVPPLYNLAKKLIDKGRKGIQYRVGGVLRGGVSGAQCGGLRNDSGRHARDKGFRNDGDR